MWPEASSRYYRSAGKFLPIESKRDKKEKEADSDDEGDSDGDESSASSKTGRKLFHLFYFH